MVITLKYISFICLKPHSITFKILIILAYIVIQKFIANKLYTFFNKDEYK